MTILVVPRFYLRVIAIPILLFTAALLTIRAQPYDDHGLHELLLPEGCPKPCFMGIRPGVTTTGEAIKLLLDNEWVRDTRADMLDLPGFPNNIHQISWNWNKTSPQLPRFIDTQKRGLVTFGNDIVYGIDFETSVRLGDYWLVESMPKKYNLRSVRGSDTGNALIVLFMNTSASIILRGSKPCPYNISGIWQTTISLSFRELQEIRSLPNWFADPLFIQHVNEFEQACRKQ